MEDINFKTILYVIFAIIWAFYNYFKKNKTSEQSQDSDEHPTFEEEIFQKQDPIENPPSPIIKKNEVKESFIITNREYSFAQQSTKKTPEEISRHTIKDKIKEPLEESIEIEIDPEKMILYSEILKRPSY